MNHCEQGCTNASSHSANTSIQKDSISLIRKGLLKLTPVNKAISVISNEGYAAESLCCMHMYCVICLAQGHEVMFEK